MAAEPVPAQISAACEQVRPAAPADAVAGMQPRIVAAPASTGEASALLRAAAELGLAVVPRGTGTRLSWGNPPARWAAGPSAECWRAPRPARCGCATERRVTC